ncbi:hypothetical protein AR685_15965 [Chryseobacterium sp. JAH]|nr:hypothetical protein AR685_15965 [Chryseobacterium sp. JAH]
MQKFKKFNDCTFFTTLNQQLLCLSVEISTHRNQSSLDSYGMTDKALNTKLLPSTDFNKNKFNLYISSFYFN